MRFSFIFLICKSISYGKLATDVGQNIAIFAQQGNSLAKSIELTKAALAASAAAGLDTAESVEFLTSATKSYTDFSENMIGIVDKIVAVEQKHAVTAKDLGNVFKVTANAPKNLNVSL